MVVEDPGNEALAELLLIDSEVPCFPFLAFSFSAFLTLFSFCWSFLDYRFFGLDLSLERGPMQASVGTMLSPTGMEDWFCPLYCRMTPWKYSALLVSLVASCSGETCPGNPMRSKLGIYRLCSNLNIGILCMQVSLPSIGLRLNRSW